MEKKNLKYFCKYLPVEGETKEGDRFIDKGVNNLIGTAHIPEYYDNPHVSYYNGYQKVKLFLCSRDIQIGDKIWSKITDELIEYRYTNSIDFEENLPPSYSGEPDKTAFKVIGEISPEATWVTENQEFNKTEVRKAWLNKFTKKFSLNPNPIEAYIEMWQIKCPTCKKFH